MNTFFSNNTIYSVEVKHLRKIYEASLFEEVGLGFGSRQKPV